MSEQSQPPVSPLPPAAFAQPAAPRPPRAKGGIGVAALVLGIIAFVLAWIPFASYMAIGLGGIGLILGILALVLTNRRTGAGVAGTIVSGIALLAAILMTVLYAALFSAVSHAAADLPGSGATAAARATSSPAAKPGTPKVAPIATAAQVGDFQVMITQVEEGVPQLGDTIAGTFFGEKAQGSFTLVHLTVKNTGSSAAYFTSGDVTLLDTQKRQFSADDTASLYIKDNDNTLFGQINPGNTLQGVVAFDIPSGAAPTVMQYDGGLLGGGKAQFALK